MQHTFYGVATRVLFPHAFARVFALLQILTSSNVTRLSRAGPSESIQVEFGGDRAAREFDQVLWTAGQKAFLDSNSGFVAPSSAAADPPAKGLRIPFARDSRGSLITDPTLRVRAVPRAFAIGDVSACVSESGAPLPATAQVAFQQSDYAAWNVWASINRRPLLPFRYQHLGELMSLGNANASVAVPVPVPSALADALNSLPVAPQLLEAFGVRIDASEGGYAPSGINISGPIGAGLRRAAYLYRQPTGSQRSGVAQSWVQQVVQNTVDQAKKR